MQIALIQASFARVFARKAELADHFFHHLFQALPEAEGWFNNDIVKQKEMFSTMLASSMQALSDAERFQTLGAELAQKHAGLGLTTAHLKATETALMQALNETSGSGLSAEETAAWQAAISQLTQMMAPALDG